MLKSTNARDFLPVPRVLLLFSSGELGGAERSLTRMAIQSKKIDFYLATIGKEGSWTEWAVALGRRPTAYGDRNLWSLILSLYRDIVGDSINVVYVCGARASLLLRFIVLFAPGVKIVHGVRWNPSSSSWLDVALRVVERTTGFLVDGWIVNSAIAKTTLINKCGISEKKISVIYNGVESLSSQPPAMEQRQLHVVTVANLSARKGVIEFLSVVRDVVASLPNARFIFLGRDDLFGVFQRQVAALGLGGHVDYCGFQNDVGPWLSTARVFALPSLWNEGCPTSILEAMSFSTPCVAFAIDGIPELIIDGEHGFLIEKGDYVAMGEKILALLTDDELASRQGQRCRRRISEHFSLHNSTTEHEKFLYELIDWEEGK